MIQPCRPTKPVRPVLARLSRHCLGSNSLSTVREVPGVRRPRLKQALRLGKQRSPRLLWRPSVSMCLAKTTTEWVLGIRGHLRACHLVRRTLQVRRGGHYICTERATLDPTTRVTATRPEDWFFEAVQRIGGTCNCFAGQLAFDLHLISPIAAAGAEILLIACYRVVSAVRKSVTVVARQTSVVLDRQSEHIADAAFGLDDPRRT
jgi:hypothetical protein